ncbi:MAG TPA: arylamine N-acetyltransferase [Myxococcales bacterium]|jgi:N-hydroxyarylamine O-acetyltransferase|nr:arylamine N-acetyltransferase [Myxococcales bacterium]
MNAREYLGRLGVQPPAAAAPLDEPFLRGLHRAHLRAVPFENLDIHLGRPIRLEPEALFHKVVHERRGGFCYELNGLFGWLLEQLGFSVTRLSARVYSSTGALGPEFDHLALRVDAGGGRPLLCDVGFGEGFLEPLPLEPGESWDGRAAYRLSASGGDWLYERRAAGGGWEKEYAFTLVPRRMEEFLQMCAFHQTSPESPFTRKRVCSIATLEGRLTLSDGKLIETRGEERTVTPVAEAGAEAALLRERFGVTLPRAKG